MFGIGGAQANIKAVITAEDRASAVLRGFGNKVGALGGVIGTGLKVAAAGIAAGTAAATAFGVLSVKAFSESQDVAAQTAAVLKSTGSAAGVTADMAQKLAKNLQSLTKFSDEQIQSGENLLLTFTKIGKDIFPQATETMLNMSQALGQDTKASAIQLGKALQDPILGVTALRRVGVNFSRDQQEVIKKLVESGNSAKAQKLILKELNTEFGNSARAAGSTFSGQLTILKNNLNDVQETIGGVLVKAITPFISKVAEAVKAIDWEAVINKTIKAVTNFWINTIVPFSQKVANLASIVFNFLKPSLEALWKTIQTQLMPALTKLWKQVIVPLAPFIGTILVLAIWALINALRIMIKVFSIAISVGSNVIGFFIRLPGAIGRAVGGVYNAITTPFKKAFDWVMRQINTVKDALSDLKNAISNVLNAPGKAAGGVGNFGKSILNKLPHFADGGIVPGRIGQPQLAVVHGGETVIPTKGGGIQAGGGQLNIVVNIGMYAGTQQEKRRIGLELVKAAQEAATAKSTTLAQMAGL